jgi:sugar phosphate isomerase/epimerase
MEKISRRSFVKVAGMAGALAPLGVSARVAADDVKTTRKRPVPFSLGIASYTFRAFTLDQVIAMARRLRIARVTLKDMHLPLSSTPEEIRAVLGRLHEAGMELSSCGVVYMTSEKELENAFAYAQAAKITMLVGVPEAGLLGLAERKVKETGIALAIHNHGPTDKRYPSPESAYALIRSMDRRMGLCIDVGHTQRMGLEPAHEVERFFDRLLDVHIKDVSASDAAGTTVEIGRGVIDIRQLLKNLAQLGYDRTVHFEHEKDEKDPLPGLAESVGFVRGLMATL